MHGKIRARWALAGGLLFGIFGSVLGGVTLGMIAFLPQLLRNLGSSPSAAIGVMGLLSFCMLFALVFAGPFGLLVGSVFGCWLAGRAGSGISRQRLLGESAALGAGLGAPYPLFLNTVFPRMAKVHVGSVALFVATGAAVGMVCGLALARLATRPDPPGAEIR